MYRLLNIVRLLLVLIYPLPSSQVYKLIRNRDIKIMEVACVSIIPNIVLVSTSQFYITSYHPVLNIKLTYECVIPTMSINFVGSIVMLLVLYKIHYLNHHIHDQCIFYCFTFLCFCSIPRAETKWQGSHVFPLLK